MTPSINRMLKLLTENELRFVDKEKVIELESTIIHTLNFDFAILSPLPFLERFLRLLDFYVLGIPAPHGANNNVISDSSRLQSNQHSTHRPSSLLFPIATDLLKFIHAHEHLISQLSHSLIAAGCASLAHKMLTNQKYLVVSNRWLQVPQLWSLGPMEEQTGIRVGEFSEFMI
jgi:hypothetical protein